MGNFNEKVNFIWSIADVIRDDSAQARQISRCNSALYSLTPH